MGVLADRPNRYTNTYTSSERYEAAAVGDPKAPSTPRRRLVEDQCCIDVGVLYRAGKLVPGTCSVWSWSRGTGIIGAVNLLAKAHAIEICGYVATGTGTEPVQDVLQIARVPARFANPPCGARPGCYLDVPSLPWLPEPTPKALHRWPAMSVSAMPQAGLCRRSQGSRWPQSAQGCQGAGEAWSCAGICMSCAATICPCGRQARWTRRGPQKI